MQRTRTTHQPELTIGVVVPTTGRLAQLGHPMTFVMNLLTPRLDRITNGGRHYKVRLVARDSYSDPEAARRAARELILEDHAHVILTLAGTRVLPAVADTCESLSTPCVTSALPWQVFFYGRGATTERPFRWTYHFCWGLGDIAAVFAEIWENPGIPTASRLSLE
jgi:branched-chain amino acid transport system substrate-binding protein